MKFKKIRVKELGFASLACQSLKKKTGWWLKIKHIELEDVFFTLFKSFKMGEKWERYMSL